MTSLQIAGRLLTASLEDRVLRYLLLPFGEEGRTSIGKLTASADSVTVPDDVTSLVANLEHDEKRPVGRFLSVETTPTGLEASVRIAKTSAGDDVLLEAAEGLRPGISVEVEGPVVRAGRLVAGVLSGAGLVTRPAFPSALMTAADVGDLPEEPTEPTDPAEPESVVIDGIEYVRKTTPTEPAGDDAEQSADTESETQVNASLTAAAAAAPQGLQASHSGPKTDAQTVFAVLAAAYREGGVNRMTAALSDIVPGNILGLEQPQLVGELWSGRAFQRKIVPLFNHANLTSFEVKGWRWVTKPVVAAYTGNKTAVPSNAVSTAPVTINAERIAGAHDIDRKFKDFGDAEFFQAYYKAMTESYAQVSDAAVLADAIAAAGAAVTVGTVPSGVSLGMTMIVDGALAVLNDANALPTFAVVSTGLYRNILLTRSDDTLTYLNAALGLEDGTLSSFRVIPSGSVAAGQVLVGAREALTVHELGETPIRVEAENIANGGVDAGVFGYYATNVHDADALVLVDDGVI